MKSKKGAFDIMQKKRTGVDGDAPTTKGLTGMFSDDDDLSDELLDEDDSYAFSDEERGRITSGRGRQSLQGQSKSRKSSNLTPRG